MPPDTRLCSARFPRSSQYHPEWVLANASGGANALWLTEWLATALDLRPGMRVLDLGCGRASSSIFLRREFGVQVWATDLWFSAAENIQRIRDAGVEDGVFPLHADARSLPFAPDFFDAIVCIDSFPYFGTDDLYLNYLAQFVKPGGPDRHRRGRAGAGDRRPGSRTPRGVVDPGLAGPSIRRPGGGGIGSGRASWTSNWPTRCRTAGKSGWTGTGRSLRTTPRRSRRSKPMAGRYLGYVRLVGRRRGEAKLEEYCWPDTLRSLPAQYTKKPLLREQD